MKQPQADIMAGLTAPIVNLFPRLNEEEQHVSVQIYRLLAEGEPVSPGKIAETLNMLPESVKNILSRWWGIYYNNDGHIIGYWGLSLPKTEHRFEIDGHELYTWCAWDTLFIPEIIGKTAHVESICPVTKEKIQLNVGSAGITRVAPANLYVSFVMPDEVKVHEDVVKNFCHRVYFFSSKESILKWASEHKGTLILSLDEAFELGHRKNKTQYKNILGA